MGDIGSDNARKKPRKTSTILLAAACAGFTANPAAAAIIVSEPPDFSDFSSSATNLGPGVQVVTGSVSNADVHDYFKVTGLQPSVPFSINVTFTPAGSQHGGTLAILNSSGIQLDSEFFFDDPVSRTLTGTIPGDGILIGAADSTEGGGGAYSFSNFPEPGGAALAAAAALAALARRKRKHRTPH
jgi:hypothetical protein